jgi:2-dehydro-3-deoxyphosphogluconate aldolase / (4S)-4-hydroxy-2-oxoglutarate aldolase
MAFNKQQIISEMKRTGIVPLFTHDNAEDALQVVKTSYDAGIRAFEFTNRRSNSLDVFNFLDTQRSHFPDLMLGIGTVMDAATTKKFIDAGADYIISPIMNLEMAPICHKNDKLWIPGCATLTEIVTARQHGAEVIKVFPGSVLGPAFLSAIMPVVPGLQLMVTGGVEASKENLQAWFKAGAMCVGMGSNLFSKEIIEKRDWKKLKQVITQISNLIQEIKKQQ